MQEEVATALSSRQTLSASKGSKTLRTKHTYYKRDYFQNIRFLSCLKWQTYLGHFLILLAVLGREEGKNEKDFLVIFPPPIIRSCRTSKNIKKVGY